jgi:hypothetical protein
LPSIAPPDALLQKETAQAEGHYALANNTLGIWVVKLNFKTNVLTELRIEASIIGTSATSGPKSNSQPGR